LNFEVGQRNRERKTWMDLETDWVKEREVESREISKRDSRNRVTRGWEGFFEAGYRENLRIKVVNVGKSKRLRMSRYFFMIKMGYRDCFRNCSSYGCLWIVDKYQYRL
jgi:uncharacterized lipoprotein